MGSEQWLTLREKGQEQEVPRARLISLVACLWRGGLEWDGRCVHTAPLSRSARGVWECFSSHCMLHEYIIERGSDAWLAVWDLLKSRLGANAVPSMWHSLHSKYVARLWLCETAIPCLKRSGYLGRAVWLRLHLQLHVSDLSIRRECRKPISIGRPVACAYANESPRPLAAWVGCALSSHIVCTHPYSAAHCVRFRDARDHASLIYFSSRILLNVSSIFCAHIVLLRVLMLKILRIQWTSGEAYHPGPLPRVAHSLYRLFHNYTSITSSKHDTPPTKVPTQAYTPTNTPPMVSSTRRYTSITTNKSYTLPTEIPTQVYLYAY